MPGPSPRQALRRRLVAILGGLVVAALALAQDQPPELSSGWTPKQPVYSSQDMVAAANPLAVEAGYETLRRGGNAIDAAIAVQMVLNLVEPQSSGIGGGAFMLYRDGASRRLVAYDGRETAPAAAKPDRFLGSDGKPVRFFDAVIGGRSVGVPGTLRMLELAHREHGKLPWQDLFARAIELSEQGFAVSPRLHTLIVRDRLWNQARARDYFHNPDGAALAAGQTLRNPAFAATLRSIAAEGAAAFYRGPIAADVVETVRGAADPSDMTEADLASYRAVARQPVCGSYRVYRVCGMPPPSSGGITVLEILGLLERFDLAALGPQSLMSVHLFSEAGKLAYADRIYVADPAFVPVPAGLTDPDYLRDRSAQIRIDRSMGRAAPGEPGPARLDKAAFGAGMALELPSTSHICIVDRYGNAIAMTTTIEFAFGSHLMTRGGFLLNNELTDFSFTPTDEGRSVANRVEAGKRPRSAMAPTIVLDAKGRVVMLTGSAGASAIINDVAKTLIAVLDWKLNPQAAVDLPNVGSRNGPTELERGTAVVALEPRLRALGHDTRVGEDTSGLLAIVRTPAGWVAGADPRREGTAKGR
jgi:gamma-glutamyltranspeptidase/glutathione hydrolase